MEKQPVLSNCLLQSILYWLFIPKSKIRFYYNRKYKTFSFYLIVRDKYKIVFVRDRTKPKFSKFLFHVKPKYLLINS